MRSQQQTGIRRFFTSPIFLFIALGVAIFTAFTYGRAYYQNYKINQEISNLEMEVKNLEKNKLESMNILNYVMSQNYVEDSARTELNMKKPGENVIFINNLVKDEKETKKVDFLAVEEIPLKNPIKWWYYFTHKPIN